MYMVILDMNISAFYEKVNIIVIDIPEAAIRCFAQPSSDVNKLKMHKLLKS